MNAPTVSMLVLAATAGLAAGFLLAWLFLRGKQSRQASEREALNRNWTTTAAAWTNILPTPQKRWTR